MWHYKTQILVIALRTSCINLQMVYKKFCFTFKITWMCKQDSRCNSSVDVVSSTWTGWPRNHSSIAGGNKSCEIPPKQSICNTSGAHSTFCSMGSKDSFPELKRHGHEADHSPTSNAKLIMHESITPFPMCPHGMHRDNFFIFIFHY